MGFKEYKKLDLVAISEEVLSFWKKEKIFEKSIALRDSKSNYVFYEGPPSANGKPGIHHVLARTIKDIFCRYKTQKGFRVERKAGWDTHGLPVELGVERELNISKEDIGKKISVKKYNAACKKAVMRYTDVWNHLTWQIGFWVDMERPYITYKSKYIESVWWLLQKIYKKNLLYKGYAIQPYSPMAGTGLSSHELNQPGTYKDVKDTAIIVQFKSLWSTLPDFLKTDGCPLYFLAWTTTPWTLPSNTALTVGKKISYAIVKTYNQYTHIPIRIVLAENVVRNVLKDNYFEVESESFLKNYKKGNKKIPYFKITTTKGGNLLGCCYEKVWSAAPLPISYSENAFRVIAGDFVTTEEGTGIVHTAPTFGADDAKAAREAIPPVPALLIKDENSQLVPLVDLQGKFRKELGPLGGKYVKNEYYESGKAPEKSVDIEIAIQLKKENAAFKVEKYTHSYPHCWRTDSPILYYPLDSWFIKVSSIQDRMVALNEKINWNPKATGEKRFKNWLSNANDWNISRTRFWGIPLPIWKTKDGKKSLVIGSVEELSKEIEKSIIAKFMKENPFRNFETGNMSEENYAKIDLHKHTIDKIILVSSDNEPMYREFDLIDVWFDSGAMPYAQWHYPFENKEKIDDKKFFPADYIAEGVDQTRGWFYTLHVISCIVFDSIAYKNVVSNGLVLDKKGQKMSKRLNNSIDPFEILKVYGADAMRWYMIVNSNPWDDLRFDLEGIKEVKNKFFGTLYNTYSFFSLYANVDNFSHSEPLIPIKERDELDQWVMSELNSLIIVVDNAYNNYDSTFVARAISNFTQEILSNWYVRLSRRRFWKGTYNKDKIAAYQTLYSCLLTLTKLAAPIIPFYSDKMYSDIVKGAKTEVFESVHLSHFPIADKTVIQKKLEKRMKTARIVTSLIFSLRKREQLKVRQPLQKVMVSVLDKECRGEILCIKNLILSETNIKEIEILDNNSKLIKKEIQPNYSYLGQKYREDTNAIAKALGLLDPEIFENTTTKIINYSDKLGEDKEIKLELGKHFAMVSKDIEDWSVVTEKGFTVALDTTLNENLIYEGLSRELVNRIQNYRKNIGLEITDKISVFVESNTILETVIKNNLSYIKTETLANKLAFKEEIKNGIAIAFDNIDTKLLIKKHYGSKSKI